MALSSITLPRAKLILQPLELNVANHVALSTMIPMIMADGTAEFKTIDVMMSEQKEGHVRVQFAHGVDYLKGLLAIWESKLSQSLKEKDQITKWIQFSWEGEDELVVDGMPGTALDFEVHWSELMGWVKRVKRGEGQQDDVQVGPQAIPMTRETSAGHALMRVKDRFISSDELITIEPRQNKQDTFMFSSKVKWRFININAMFERVVGPR